MSDTALNQAAEPTQTETENAPDTGRFSLLARQKFGNNFKGEVSEAPQEPAEQPEETEQIEEAPEETLEATEEPEVGEHEGEESQEEIVSSLDELIEAQQWDREWVQGLKIPVKIDGEESQATLSDLVKSYQMSEAAEKRLEDAKAKSKAITEQLQQKAEGLNAQYATAATLIQNAEKLLDADTSAIDWNKLREDDPAEFSAKKEEIRDRREQINNLKRQAVENYQNSISQATQGTQQERLAQLQAEQQALLEKLPDWRDPEKADAEKTKLVGYLTGQGFEQEDVMGASDHRLILLARKAMLYDEQQSKSDVAKKKLTKVPKVLKPGTPKSNDQVQQEQIDKQRQKLKGSRSLEDALALMKTRRKS